MKKTLETYNQVETNYPVRYETLSGERHIIVPVVMMVEGVHSGSAGPLFHSIDQLGRYPASWNGMPVVINHPYDQQGNALSANEVGLEGGIVGRVYNTHVENSKLKGECWINERRLIAINPELVQHINEGKPMEVSIGVFTDEIEQEGQWNGEYYNAIATNHRPDHLALLPNDLGACSIADGCGLRVNQQNKDMETENKPNPSVNADDGKENPEIVDNANIVNPDANKSTTPTQLHLFADGQGTTDNDDNSSAQVVTFEVRQGKDGEQTTKMITAFNYLQTNAGFMEISRNIQRELDRQDNNSYIHFLEDVYDNYFIYRRSNMQTSESAYYKRAYSVNTDDTIEFNGDPEMVSKKISYEPVNNSKEVTKSNANMDTNKDCKCAIDALIANKLTRYDDKDREWLEKLDVNQLKKLEPIEVKPDVVNNTKEDPKELLQKAFSSYEGNEEELINSFPGNLKESIQSGLALHNAQKKRYVDGIIANSSFTEDEVKTWGMSQLSKMYDALTANKTDYSVNGNHGIQHSDEFAEEHSAMFASYKQEK